MPALYASWKERDENVTSLQLDAENPRMPPSAAPLAPRELIAELLEHENLMELIRDISREGYYPGEFLIGMEKDGTKVILEGNRRLAALKLLISPEQAPEKYQERIRKLATSVVSAVSKVRVIYAPTREAAAPIILRRHTREQIERWSTPMQARFFRSLMAAGVSQQTLTEDYGISASDMGRFLRTDSIYEAARVIELPEDVRKEVADPRKFPISVLQRLIEVPKFREFLGIDFDSAGNLQGKVAKEEFAKGLKRVLTDIARKKIDTRAVNKTKDVEKYLGGLKADEPDKTKKGTFTIDDLAPGGASGSPKPKDPPPKPKPKPKPGSKSIVPRGTTCTVSDDRIRDVFIELRKLDIKVFPNATSALLRILLELSCGHYLDETGKIKPLLEKAKKDGKKKDWYPALRALLDTVLKDDAVQLTPLQHKAVQQMLSKPDALYTVDDLDSYIHNRYVTPTEKELRGFWSMLTGLFDVLLADPPPPVKKT